MVQRVRALLASPWWKTFLPLIFIVLFAVFFVQQWDELRHIIEVVRTSRMSFLIGGLVLVQCYILVQALMYQSVFRSIHKTLPIPCAVQLYLKRFFVGTFIPAGYTVAQYAYTKGLRNLNISQLENHLGSTIYLLICSITYAMLLVPTLVYLFFTGKLTPIESLLAGACLAITVVFLWACTHVRQQKGVGYKLLSAIWPDIPSFLASWKDKTLDWFSLKKAVFYSFLLYALQISMFLIIFRALNMDDAFLLAIVSFVVSFLIVYLSPVFQGLGLVEISLVSVLKQYGIDGSVAVTITILYRLFQLWLPLLISGSVILYNRVRK